MANQLIAFNVPTAYEDRLAAIDRAQKMAEMLQQQAYEPLQSTGGYKGIPAPISPLSGLAKMLEAYSAKKELDKVKTDREALSEENRAGLEDYLNNAPKGTEAIPGTPGTPATMGTTGAVNDYFKPPESQNIPGLAMPLDQAMPSLGTPGMAATEGTPDIPAQPATRAQMLAHAMQGVVSGNPRLTPLATAQYTELTKVREPMKLGAGDTIYDPNTGKPIFSAPAGPRGGDLGVYDEYRKQEIAAGRVPISIEKFITNQKIAGRAPAAVTYGAPVAAVDANGNPVFIQPGKAGGAPSVMPGFTPPPEKLRPIPAPVNAGIIQNNATLGKINNALALIGGKTKEGDKEATGVKGYLPNVVLNRIDPEGTLTRAEIADIGSQIVHDRSGAAVTISETPRLLPFIPQTTDDAATVTKKLKRLAAAIQAEQEATNQIYSKEQGYKPAPDLGANKSATRKAADDILGGG